MWYDFSLLCSNFVWFRQYVRIHAENGQILSISCMVLLYWARIRIFFLIPEHGVRGKSQLGQYWMKNQFQGISKYSP